ncbi:MAG: shikimate dehydrogenase, partial [Bacilli bacterium]|nr:shikimate dehydrogenase [Bacilli bacterium]
SREEYLYLDNYITYDVIGKYEYDILINATPVGTSPNYLDSLIDFDKIRITKGGIVIDLIYNPLRTKLLIEANNHGFYAYNGLEMLIYQALYSYYLFDDKYKDLINDDELF